MPLTIEARCLNLIVAYLPQKTHPQIHLRWNYAALEVIRQKYSLPIFHSNVLSSTIPESVVSSDDSPLSSGFHNLEIGS